MNELKVIEKLNNEELKNAITSKDVTQIKDEILIIGQVENEIEQYEKFLKKEQSKVKEYKKLLEETKELAEAKALEYISIYGEWKTKVNNETGEVEKKFYHNAPEGFKYFNSRITVVYDESKIPEEYFKVERKLKIREVEKAISEGKLKYEEVVKETIKGDPYVKLNPEGVKNE